MLLSQDLFVLLLDTFHVHRSCAFFFCFCVLLLGWIFMVYILFGELFCPLQCLCIEKTKRNKNNELVWLLDLGKRQTVLWACLRSFFQTAAMVGSKGSSGLGDWRRTWMERHTLSICSAGDLIQTPRKNKHTCTPVNTSRPNMFIPLILENV